MTEPSAQYVFFAYAISLAVMGGYAIVLWSACRWASGRERRTGGQA